MSCPDVPIGRFYNVNKSCQVIVANPPIDQGLKSSQFQGTRVIRLSQRSRPQQGLIKLGISINGELSSLFITHSLTQLQRIAEEEDDTRARKKDATVVRRSSYCFGVLLLVLILSLRKLWVFSFMVSLRKIFVSILSFD